ncbi:hypothetical protein J1N35_016569 [Gossypium stocksii]|uniref:Uncharacterized protein n=1 Tax=Gossypium stocksii TaxID=47602 RepID=A0A9D3VLI4_9ROSI|nr:hypothetical protein J1N35_016569 [Gossypium stocksii]
MDVPIDMSSSMEVELTSICMDKESDCVIIYSNGSSQDSNNEAFSSNHNAMQSCEWICGASRNQRRN